MSSLFEYNGIVTKVRAMKKGLLGKQDYEKLVYAPGIPDAIQILRQHQGYRTLFVQTDEESLHRSDIENVLWKNLLDDYGRLYRFSDTRLRKYLQFYKKKYEVKILKTALSIINDHKRNYLEMQIYAEFFNNYTNIDLGLVNNSSSVKDFILKLRDTEYFPILEPFVHVEEARVYDCETALDLYYFTDLWKHKDKVLEGVDLSLFMEDCGCDIDMMNIQFIYRLKKYYRMQEEEIRKLLIPVRHKLRDREIQALLSSTSEEEFLRHLRTTFYRKYCPESDTFSLEKAYRSLRERIYGKQVRLFPNSIASIHSYLYLKEMEINKLTTLFECIRYQVEPLKMFERIY